MNDSHHSDYVKVLKIKGANGEERTLQFPLKLDLERPKRPRTTFSDEQLRLLEEAFQENGYLTGEARLALATRLALSDTQLSLPELQANLLSSSPDRTPPRRPISALSMMESMVKVWFQNRRTKSRKKATTEENRTNVISPKVATTTQQAPPAQLPLHYQGYTYPQQQFMSSTPFYPFPTLMPSQIPF